jgi:predicted MFS family arabinose efflux permease
MIRRGQPPVPTRPDAMEYVADRRAANARFTVLMAAACGISVANLYYAQPLLQQFAQDFHVTIATIGVVPSAVQVGYAAGLILLGPLGDRHARHRIILWLSALLVPATVSAALAPSVAWLAAAAFAIGVLSSIAQQIIPLVAHLARPEERGRSIGTVMSGLMIGILGGRVIAGAVAQWASWRFVFIVGAVLDAAMFAMLWAILPRQPAPADGEHRRYLGLIVSTFSQLGRFPELRSAALTGALFFGSFSVFWVGLTPLLQSAAYGYGPAVVGAFGLLGIAGASAAAISGRWSDRARGPRRVRGVALLIVLSSWAAAAVGGHALWGLVVGIVVVDAGCQAAHIANQASIHALPGDVRNRVNALYMTCYFGGGALGSLLASHAWSLGGWSAVVFVGAGFALLALLAHGLG